MNKHFVFAAIQTVAMAGMAAWEYVSPSTYPWAGWVAAFFIALSLCITERQLYYTRRLLESYRG